MQDCQQQEENFDEFVTRPHTLCQQCEFEEDLSTEVDHREHCKHTH